MYHTVGFLSHYSTVQRRDENYAIALRCLSPPLVGYSFGVTGQRGTARSIIQSSAPFQSVHCYSRGTAYHPQQPPKGPRTRTLTYTTNARDNALPVGQPCLGCIVRCQGSEPSFERDVLPLIPMVTKAQRHLISEVINQPYSPYADPRVLSRGLTDNLTQVANSELRQPNGLPTHLDTQERINLLSARAYQFLAQARQFQQDLSPSPSSRQPAMTSSSITSSRVAPTPSVTRSIAPRLPGHNECHPSTNHARTVSPYGNQFFPLSPLVPTAFIAPVPPRERLNIPNAQRRPVENRHASSGTRVTETPNRAPSSASREQTIDREMAYWLCNTPVTTTSTKWWQQPDTSRSGVQAFADLLHRLRHHHQHFPQENLQQRVSTILQALENDTELRHKALAVAYEGSSSCVDRAIYSFTQLEACHEINQIIRDKTQPHDAAMLQKLRGIIRQEKLTHRVNKIVEKRRADDVLRNDGRHVDAIEVHLAYTIGLRERLGLPGQTMNMTFAKSAGVSDEDLRSAGDKLLEDERHPSQGGLLTAITDHPYWKLYLENQYQSAHDADERISAFGEKQDQLDKKNETGIGRIQYFYKQGYINAERRDRELTEQEISYTTQCNQLMEERKQQSAGWYQAKSQELITKWLAT